VKLLWTERGWEDYVHWQTHDREVLAKINMILRDVARSPYRGLGKPEPLRFELAGWWSRRITQADRLVYRVVGRGDEQRIEVAQCRAHYND
jgi:toxin YoeB